MRRFPSDFSQLLTPLGQRVLAGKAPEFRSLFKRSKTPFAVLERMIDTDKARACTRLLDRHLHHLLSAESHRIPADSISGMRENYSESLEKIMKFKTSLLHRRGTPAYRAAEALGMMAMMESEGLAAFAEAVSGLPLERPAGVQVICYEHGDYVGPHNDHHPEDDPTRLGYVDVHVMFCNDAVAHQFLIYEQERHLSQIVDVNMDAGISIYKLPFWHHVTPLVGKPGRESGARRWLLLGTFDIDHAKVRSRRKRPRKKRLQAGR